MTTEQVVNITTTIAMRLSVLELHSKNASQQVKNVLFCVGSDGFITEEEKQHLKNALNALESIGRRISPYDVAQYTEKHISGLSGQQ